MSYPLLKKLFSHQRPINYLLYLLLIALPAVAKNIHVETAKVAEIAFYPERSAPATVMSLNEGLVSTEIAARIDMLLVRVGDVIAQGDVLARLDCRDYVLVSRQAAARLRALQARRDLAKRHLQRTRQLILKQSIAEEILDKQESELVILDAELDEAKAVLERSKLDESRCTVLSPFKALVLERSSVQGEFVKIGDPLLRIMDINEIEISAQVLNRDITQINDASELFFEHDGIRYLVILKTVMPIVNTETGNRELRLTVTDNSSVLPGASGQLVWRDNRAHIPSYLLVNRNGVLGVFTMEDNVARFNAMPHAQSGRANATLLHPDTEIVIKGHYALIDHGQLIMDN